MSSTIPAASLASQPPAPPVGPLHTMKDTIAEHEAKPMTKPDIPAAAKNETRKGVVVDIKV